MSLWLLFPPIFRSRLRSISRKAHLRNVFYRMGFGDEGIVALSGAHTLGRAQKVRTPLLVHVQPA